MQCIFGVELIRHASVWGGKLNLFTFEWKKNTSCLRGKSIPFEL